MGRSMTGRFALALLLLAGGAGIAAAQQPSKAQGDAIRQSCRADYQSHCAGVPTGGKAAFACLQQNAASLSPACQSAVAAVGGGGATSKPSPATAAPPAGRQSGTMREKAGQIRAACGMDYREYCRGIRPGGERAMSCLAEHEASLSPGCQRAMSAMRQAR